MRTPTTSLDQRFSDSKATATTWDDTRAALESAELFWITSVRADGRPHVTPLVSVWLNGMLYFGVGADEQKAVNLRGNRHVILTTGCNEWDKGLDVVVEGEANRVTDHEELVRLAEAWTHKWDGRWHYVVGSNCFHHPYEEGDTPEPIYVYGVSISKALAFARGVFGHTRHVF